MLHASRVVRKKKVLPNSGQRIPLTLGTASKDEAQLKRMIMSRMNALARLWGSGEIMHSNNVIKLVSSQRHIEIAYETFHNSVAPDTMYYDLVIKHTGTGQMLSSTSFTYQPGSEVVPTADKAGLVFSDAKNQAHVFAEAIAEFCRCINQATREYDDALEKAKQLLPRST